MVRRAASVDPDGPVWRVSDRGLRIRVHVQPRASRSGVAGLHGGALKVLVAAPPVEGEANRAVIDLLAKWLRVPRGSISVTLGGAARDKVVEVCTDEPLVLGAALEARLAHLR